MPSIYLPLHHGKAPYWLLNRMKKLAKPIITLIIQEYGEKEFFRRVSDPIFFQSFSNVLGFDWNSSGVTTVMTGVLKSVLNESEFEIRVAGGKGKNAIATPEDIRRFCDELDISADELITASRYAAKVDNVALQDGYTLYHHAVIFSPRHFTIIQQGMNERERLARRYHWNPHEEIPEISEVHSGIAAERREKEVVNLVSDKSDECRKTILDVVNDRSFRRDYSRLISITRYKEGLAVPKRIDWKAVETAYQLQPERFEDLLLIRGLGKGAVRALALIADLIYNDHFDRQDPAKYSFALGGKDGVPFPVDRRSYDEVIQFMNEVVRQADLQSFQKAELLKKLGKLQV